MRPCTSWLLLAKTCRWPHGLQARTLLIKHHGRTALYSQALSSLGKELVSGNLALVECDWFIELSFFPLKDVAIDFVFNFANLDMILLAAELRASACSRWHVIGCVLPVGAP